MKKIEIKKYVANDSLVNESLFAQSNGYIGIRGSFEEGVEEGVSTSPSVFINSFYDFFDVQYGAKYTGYPEKLQKMICLTDINGIDIYLNDEKYKFRQKDVENFKQVYDLDTGEVSRSYRCNLDCGYIDFEFKKLISFMHDDMFVQKVIVKPNLKKDITLKVTTELDNFNKKNVDGVLDKRVARVSDVNLNVLREESSEAVDGVVTKVSTTRESNKKMIAGSLITLSENEKTIEKRKVILNSTNVVISKYNVIWDDLKEGVSHKKAREKLLIAKDNGYNYYLEKNKTVLADVWQKNRVEFTNKEIEDAYNYNFYQLFSNTGKYPWTNIGAKGLTGEGYNGHYFWDTEVYIIPSLVLTMPDVTNNLSLYRYKVLENAKRRAKDVGIENGCLYSWRTINGDESSPYYPASTAEYHINGSVVYGVISNFLAHEDLNILISYGLEVIIETARMWVEKCSYYDGKYYINSVTGPDEYQLMVDNDYYTNKVARFNIEWLFNSIDLLQKDYKKECDLILKKCNLKDDELEKLKDIMNNMYYPYSEKEKVNPEHDSFLKRKKVSKEEIQKYKPLVMKLHPLTINNYQISKQADVVLADYMFGNDFGLEVMNNNYDFYRTVDTADSSLSECIYATQAARLKKDNFGVEIFKDVLYTDFKNSHKNTAGGLHMANMAGSRIYIIYGLLGLVNHIGYFKLDPVYVEEIGDYKIRLYIKSADILITINKKNWSITNLSEHEFKVEYKSNKISIRENERKEFDY